MRQNKPDALLLASSKDYTVISGWIESLNMKVPQDLGLALVELSSDKLGLSGAIRQCEAMGVAAVDLVSARLFRSEFGVNRLPYGVYIPPVWCEGKTLRQ